VSGSESDAPRKVTAAEVEVLDSNGMPLAGGRSESANAGSGPRSFGMGGIRVIRAGPLTLVFMLLLLPLLIPLLIVLLVGVMMSALVFGRAAFRIFRWGRGF